MTLTFTPAGFTLTNLIPDPFPTANFLGVKIEVLSGPSIASVAIDEAASAPDFRQGISVSSTANQVMVNLSGACGTTCNTVDDNVFFALTTAPVPEPATWVTMLLSCGLAGGALRRQFRISTRA